MTNKNSSPTKACMQSIKVSASNWQTLSLRLKKSRQNEDYIRFQLEQLNEAELREGEQAELEQEAETLSHAEDIKAGLYKVDQIMSSDEGSLLSATKRVHADLAKHCQKYMLRHKNG